MAVALAATTGVIVAAGVYLLLRRRLVALLFGIVLLGHAANVLVFATGGLSRGRPPIVPPGATAPPPDSADPLPQAFVLTAIVIGFALVAFAAALVSREAAARDAEGVGSAEEER